MKTNHAWYSGGGSKHFSFYARTSGVGRYILPKAPSHCFVVLIWPEKRSEGEKVTRRISFTEIGRASYARQTLQRAFFTCSTTLASISIGRHSPLASQLPRTASRAATKIQATRSQTKRTTGTWEREGGHTIYYIFTPMFMSQPRRITIIDSIDLQCINV